MTGRLIELLISPHRLMQHITEAGPGFIGREARAVVAQARSVR